MASNLRIKVNGLTHSVSASLDTPLLYVLHNELHLHGPRFGCGLAQCGACSVLLDGKEIRSCVTPVAAVSGKRITTLEGCRPLWAAQRGTTAGAPALHPLQQAWIDVQVPHCGYCQNGMMIQAADLLATTKHPSEDQIRTAMNGHLCRCGTYPRILTAIQQAAAVMAKGGARHDRLARARSSHASVPEGRRRADRRLLGLARRRGRGRRRGRPAPVHLVRARATRTRSTPGSSINADNTASVKLGKVELGQGSMTGLLMVAAEELTWTCPDAGDHERHRPDARTRAHGRQLSDQLGRQADPAAAAAAYQALLGLASTQLGVAEASLTVSKGVVTGGGKTVTYGAAARREALQRRDRARSTTSTRPAAGASAAQSVSSPGSGSSQGLAATEVLPTPAFVPSPGPGLSPGAPDTKPVSQYTLVGVAPSPPRVDIPAKVTGQVHLRPEHPRPGHAPRPVVRPRGQGAYGDGTSPKRALGRRALDQPHPERPGSCRRELPRRRRAATSGTRSRRRRS